jgi:hypothetical protein
VTSLAGRSSVTLTWSIPASDPQAGYRVYDVTGERRTQVVAAAGTARSIRIPGRGPRRLALVAANGRFAESPDVVVETAAVTSAIPRGPLREPRLLRSGSGSGAREVSPLSGTWTGIQWGEPSRQPAHHPHGRPRMSSIADVRDCDDWRATHPR